MHNFLKHVNDNGVRAASWDLRPKVTRLSAVALLALKYVARSMPLP